LYIPLSESLLQKFSGYWDIERLLEICWRSEKISEPTVQKQKEKYDVPESEAVFLNEFLLEKIDNVLWVEFEEEYPQGVEVEGAVTSNAIHWSLDFFHKIKEKIESDFEDEIKDKEISLNLDSIKNRYWTYFIDPKYLDEDLLIYLLQLKMETIHWERVSARSELVKDAQFLQKYREKLLPGGLIRNKNFNLEKDLYLFSDELEPFYWKEIWRKMNVSISLIEKFKDKVIWSDLAQNPFLNYEIVEKYYKKWSKVDWYWLSRTEIIDPHHRSDEFPWKMSGFLRYGKDLESFLDDELVSLFLENII
tara:strand:- start:843 stop:1760 length:918 start_codon:yes stop_codon:yes gene_type:complete